MSQNFDELLDTSGLQCPEPVMLLHKSIRQAKIGQVICLLAPDASTIRDIPKFCQFLGHKLLLQEQNQGKYSYYIEKKV
ncbi:MAG: sulfurtransferase TusA [Pseudomonadota bacterium]